MTPRSAARRTALGGALLGLAVALLGPATVSSAGTYQLARVVRVDDGDTIDVDTNHDGHADSKIRLLGLDAPEHGLCNAAAATGALTRLLGHRVVELRSQRGRTGIKNRPERRVVVTIGGQKIDAATWMLERGLAVWMPRKGETEMNLAQHQAADRAAAAGLGWFNPTRCGAGPSQEDPLVMETEYLADATYSMSPAARRNQEFIRIRNAGPTPIDIDGWTLRVGNDRSRRVPPGGAIPPGGAVEIHVGFGTNTATDRYLGSSVPMLTDASMGTGPHLGSGSYLIDPGDDIRAHTTWPCTLDCVDPSAGALRFSQVMYDPPGMEGGALNTEYVQVTNSGPVPVRTGDYVLEEFPFVYEFPADSVLQPGETVRVMSGSGDSSRLSRFLGAPVPPMHNEGGHVLLRTYDSIVLDCSAWGDGRCPAGS